jgi:ribosomal protein S27E
VYNFYETAAIFYSLIGIVLINVGPASKEIREAVKEVRNKLLSSEHINNKFSNKLRLLCFQIMVYVSFVLFWPILTYSVISDKKRNLDDQSTYDQKVKEGLWFDLINGFGEITCKDCKQTQEVTSFIHSRESSWSGFQCQSCGKFCPILAGGRGEAHVYKDSLICQCGGQLSRDKVLFCPNCKSKKITYNMDYMT